MRRAGSVSVIFGATNNSDRFILADKTRCMLGPAWNIETNKMVLKVFNVQRALRLFQIVTISIIYQSKQTTTAFDTYLLFQDYNHDDDKRGRFSQTLCVFVLGVRGTSKLGGEPA